MVGMIKVIRRISNNRRSREGFGRDRIPQGVTHWPQRHKAEVAGVVMGERVVFIEAEISRLSLSFFLFF